MTQQIELIASDHFSAAHRLYTCHLTEQQNKEIYGPCYNTHGHNYNVKIYVRASIDKITGMAVNLKILKKILSDLISEFDHKCIDTDHPYFRNNELPSTSENLAVYFFEQLTEYLRKEVGETASLVGVKLKETERYSVYYSGSVK